MNMEYGPAIGGCTLSNITIRQLVSASAVSVSSTIEHAHSTHARADRFQPRNHVSGSVTITFELVTQARVDAPLLLCTACRPPFAAGGLYRKLLLSLAISIFFHYWFCHSLLRRKIYCSVFSHLRIFLALPFDCPASNWCTCSGRGI